MMNWKDTSKTSSIDEVRSALEHLDVNERDERGRTPLMLFITNKKPAEMIAALLEHGADLEAADKLGETALIKAVKFKQHVIISLLIEHGAELNPAAGVTQSAWYTAKQKHDNTAADLLLATRGSVRLTLTAEEQAGLDAILYEESQQAVCRQIQQLDNAVLLHAWVNQYNYDDGPVPLLQAVRNEHCAWITMHDMHDLIEADYWLEMESDEIERRLEGTQWYELAALLKQKLSDSSL